MAERAWKCRSHIMTEARRIDMARKWAAGTSSVILGEEYGVHPAYVRKAAARLGYTSDNRGGRPHLIAAE